MKKLFKFVLCAAILASCDSNEEGDDFILPPKPSDISFLGKIAA